MPFHNRIWRFKLENKFLFQPLRYPAGDSSRRCCSLCINIDLCISLLTGSFQVNLPRSENDALAQELFCKGRWGGGKKTKESSCSC